MCAKLPDNKHEDAISESLLAVAGVKTSAAFMFSNDVDFGYVGPAPGRRSVTPV